MMKAALQMEFETLFGALSAEQKQIVMDEIREAAEKAYQQMVEKAV